ncbi:MAG TPA: PadR family transcriptional regulator [Acidimicrobiales bacterium]|nr:PadR family transcriptional regulator [Acidimicrobiales bacterium]
MSVRHGLLALLDSADMYGYQLKSAYEAHTGGVWPLNVGQVYTTLARLQRDGLVASADQGPAAEAGTDDRQHVYSITAKGRQVLADWFADSPAEGPPPRDELIAKVLLAAAGGAERALAVVTAQRTALTGALQTRRRSLRAAWAADAAGSPDGPDGPDGDAPDDIDGLAGALVLDALVVRAEAELRWLDQCEARLLSRRPAGAPTRRST